MKPRKKLIALLLALCVVIATLPLLLINNSEFGGADGQATNLISEIKPDYQPWAASIIELPGAETESLLFALQAALGASVLGFGFGYLVGRKSSSSHRQTAPVK